MQDVTYKVVGRFSRSQGKTGVHGLLIEVLDRDGIFLSLINKTRTHRDGGFTITYHESDCAELFRKKPEVYIRAFDRDNRVIFTQKKTKRFQPGGIARFDVELSDAVLANHFSRPVSWQQTKGHLVPREKIDQIERAISLIAAPGTVEYLTYLKAGWCPLPKIDSFPHFMEDVWGVLEGDVEAVMRFRNVLDHVHGVSSRRDPDLAKDLTEAVSRIFGDSAREGRAIGQTHLTDSNQTLASLIDRNTAIPFILAAIHAGDGLRTTGRYLEAALGQLAGYGPVETIYRAASNALQGGTREVAFFRSTLGLWDGCGPDDRPVPSLPEDGPEAPEWWSCSGELASTLGRSGIPTYAITDVSPARACARTTITITGRRFGTDPGQVRFLGPSSSSLDVSASSWADEEIRVKVPEEARAGAISLVILATTIEACGEFIDIYKLARPPGHFEGALPTIFRFQINGQGELTVEPDTALVLTWDVNNADTIHLQRTSAAGPYIDATNPSGNSYPLGIFSGTHAADAIYELTATNLCGTIRSVVSVHLRKTPALRILGVEIIQVIQHFRFLGPRLIGTLSNNSVSLVANKRTIVRVYVDSGLSDGFDNGAGPNLQPDVNGMITLIPVETGRRIIADPPLNAGGVITARPVTEINRGNLDHTLNFELPWEELSGSVRIEAGVGLGDAILTRHDRTVGNFQPRRHQIVVRILIRDRNFPASATNPPTSTDYDNSLQGSRTAYPIAEDGFVIHLAAGFETVDTTHNLTTDDGWHDLLDDIDDIADDFEDIGQIWTGLVPNGPYFWGGLGNSGGTFDGYPRLVAQAGVPGYFAHEMGHAYDVDHAPCGEPKNIDDRLPARTEDIGLDVPARQLIPAGQAELMSYCTPAWISIAFWNIVFDELA